MYDTMSEPVLRIETRTAKSTKHTVDVCFLFKQNPTTFSGKSNEQTRNTYNDFEIKYNWQ